MGVRLVLLGPPGSGKGTLAHDLGRYLLMRHLSTGELFRQAIRQQTLLGKAVNRYVSSGRLVPDALVVKVMTSHAKPSWLARGLVMDGFPRTVGQAKGLDKFLMTRHRPLTAALYLECPQRVLIDRLGGRLVCSRCGRNYHVRNMPPKRAGRCDRCKIALSTRNDDRVDTIRKRLRIDRAEAKPLLAYYQDRGLLHRVDGTGSDVQVFRRVRTLLRAKRWLK